MCLNPNYVRRYIDPNGQVQIRFYECFADWKSDKTDDINFFTLPCGKCAECCEQYSNEWAWRVQCELKSHDEKDCCFLTLTYASSPGTLVPEDLQLFIKRLRRRIEPNKLRYFACGEYGSKGQRPHYHLLLFGYRPDDLKVLKKTEKNQIIYTSDELSSIWNKGFCSVGNVSGFSAKYCAKYMQKLNDLPDNYVKPFTRASTKPGLGLDYFMQHKDEFIKTDEIYFNGRKQHIPRYFLRKVEVENDLSSLREGRKTKARLLYKDINNQKYERLTNIR